MSTGVIGLRTNEQTIKPLRTYPCQLR